MSRYNHRTHWPRNKMVDWGGLPLRPSKRTTARGALHKMGHGNLARRYDKARGLSKEDAVKLYFHGGELTKAHAEREAKRVAMGWR